MLRTTVKIRQQRHNLLNYKRELQKDFEGFVTQRCENIAQNNAKYWSHIKSITARQKELKSLINPFQRKLADKLIESTINFQSFSEELMYRKGFKDGKVS